MLGNPRHRRAGERFILHESAYGPEVYLTSAHREPTGTQVFMAQVLGVVSGRQPVPWSCGLPRTVTELDSKAAAPGRTPTTRKCGPVSVAMTKSPCVAGS